MGKASTIPEEIGRRLRALRLERGFTLESLGHAAGISWGAIQRIESGKAYARLETLNKLADVLDVDARELLGSQEAEAS